MTYEERKEHADAIEREQNREHERTINLTAKRVANYVENYRMLKKRNPMTVHDMRLSCEIFDAMIDTLEACGMKF